MPPRHPVRHHQGTQPHQPTVLRLLGEHIDAAIPLLERPSMILHVHHCDGRPTPAARADELKDGRIDGHAEVFQRNSVPSCRSRWVWFLKWTFELFGYHRPEVGAAEPCSDSLQFHFQHQAASRHASVIRQCRRRRTSRLSYRGGETRRSGGSDRWWDARLKRVLPYSLRAPESGSPRCI